ncbi:unnamed protein product [Orchesella dallaii]|uniref:LsmAD domain-containing protein n=1 Tax=Orchesella dallaii TaxID=48710 RepID=A0ABP1R067_9HEXA
MSQFKETGVAIKKLADKRWRLNWVRNLSNGHLSDVLAACDLAPLGPIDASNRERYQEILINLLRDSPYGALRSIDTYFGLKSEEAREKWFVDFQDDCDSVDGTEADTSFSHSAEAEPLASASIHRMTTMIGSPVEAAYEKDPSGSSVGTPPMYDVISIRSQNCLSLKRIDADLLITPKSRTVAADYLNESVGSGGKQANTSLSGGFATDKAITHRSSTAVRGRGRGGNEKMRELEPAPTWLCSSDETSAKLSLELDEGNTTGKVFWEPKDMFKQNEERYGLVSSFKEDLTGYTTKVDRSNAEFKMQQDEAGRIERQIRQRKRGGSGCGSGRDEDSRPRFSPNQNQALSRPRPLTASPPDDSRRNARTPFKPQGQQIDRQQYSSRQVTNSGGRNVDKCQVPSSSTQRQPVQLRATPPSHNHSAPTVTATEKHIAAKPEKHQAPPPTSDAKVNTSVKTNEKKEGPSAQKQQESAIPTSSIPPKIPPPASASQPLVVSTPKTPAEQLKAFVAGSCAGDSGSKSKVQDLKCQSPPPHKKDLNPGAKAFCPSPKKLNPNAKEFNPNFIHPISSPQIRHPTIAASATNSFASRVDKQSPYTFVQMQVPLLPNPNQMQMISPQHNPTQPYAQNQGLSSASSFATTSGRGGGRWVGTPPAPFRGQEMQHHQHQVQPQPFPMNPGGGGPVAVPPRFSTVSGILAPPQFVASQSGPYSVIRVVPPQRPIMPMVLQPGVGAQMRPSLR